MFFVNHISRDRQFPGLGSEMSFLLAFRGKKNKVTCIFHNILVQYKEEVGFCAMPFHFLLCHSIETVEIICEQSAVWEARRRKIRGRD